MHNLELSAIERKRLWGRLAIRAALIILVATILIFIVPPVFSNFFPFIAALVVAWLLHPLIQKIQKWVKIPNRLLSFVFVLLIVLVVGSVITFFMYYIAHEIISLVTHWLAEGGDLSSIFASENLLSGLLGKLPDSVGTTVQDAILNIIDWVKNGLTEAVLTITSWLGGFIKKVPSFFINIVVFISSAYFITADYSSIRLSITKHFKGGLRDFFGFVKSETVLAFGGYIKAQLILSGGVFLILLVGFLLIGQPYALSLAFIFAVLDLIPIVGAGTVLIPWAAVVLITGNYIQAIQLMAIWGVVALFRRMLEPKIMGSQTDLSPLLSLMSIYFGMRVNGVIGMVLGPIILQVVIKVIESGLFKGLLMDLKLLLQDNLALIKNESKDPSDGGI